MPNCDFYGTREDHQIILDEVFSNVDCDVFEIASDFEQPLKRFENTEQVLNEFQRVHSNGVQWWSVHLQLAPKDIGVTFKPRLVSLDPEKCGGYRYRYSADGFGLIQLYLVAPKNNRLDNSHTNCFSKKQSEQSAIATGTIEEFKHYDGDKVEAVSVKLNRFIRTLSVGKIKSRPVLPGAHALWHQGVMLGPYTKGQIEIDPKR